MALFLYLKSYKINVKVITKVEEECDYYKQMTEVKKLYLIKSSDLEKK